VKLKDPILRLTWLEISWTLKMMSTYHLAQRQTYYRFH
jgi:hypothetical protein